MKDFLNGSLQGMIEAAKRLWMIGAGLMVAVVWIFSVNQGLISSRRMEAKLDVVVATQAVDSKFMRDSLTTEAESKFVLSQTLATVRKMDNRLRHIEGRPAQEGLGRWEYFEQYGPVPERYRDWYEVVQPSAWLDAKAANARIIRRKP